MIKLQEDKYRDYMSRQDREECSLATVQNVSSFFY